jgi:hypothetical protein
MMRNSSGAGSFRVGGNPGQQSDLVFSWRHRVRYRIPSGSVWNDEVPVRWSEQI